MKRSEAAAVTCLLIAVALLAAALSSRLSRTAALVPMAAALLTLMLAAIQLRRDLRARPTADTVAQARRERVLVMLVAGTILAVVWFGLAVALPLFVAAYFRLHLRSGALESLMAAAGMFLGLAAVQGMLGLPLF